MRIGVNALYLIPGKVGGTEIYLRNLLHGLADVDAHNDYMVFTNRETGADLVPEQPNFHYAPQNVRASMRPARILWEQTLLPLAAWRQDIDVMFNPGFTAPLLFRRNVTVFHDLQHKRHPEHFRWFDLPFWSLLLWASLRRSSALIAVSAATRDDLKRFYGASSHVIHHGVEPEFFQIAQQREPKDYLLCVSTLHPHKNLDRLIRAHAGLANPLILVGLRGFFAEELERMAGPSVRIAGWIPRAELYQLFRGARAFVYPSTFEGFGMPVLEAMAAGVPVACADIAPLREIANGCVDFFDPADEKQMRDAMLRVLNQPGDTQPGRVQAAKFSWEQAARETLRVIESVRT